MWSRSRWWPATLAGQFLVLQLTVLLAVVAVASVVSVQQSDADFRDTRGARLRAAAESMANTAAVRDAFVADRVESSRGTLTSYTQRVRNDLQASGVYLTDPDGVVLVSSDFAGRGEPIDLGDSTVQQLRAWTGDVDDFGDARRSPRRCRSSTTRATSSASSMVAETTRRGASGPAACCPTC